MRYRLFYNILYDENNIGIPVNILKYIISLFHYSDQSLIRKISKRQVDSNAGDSLKIFGFNVIEADKAEMEHGIPVLKAGSKVTLRLFGNGFTKQTTIGLTSEPHEIGAKCIKIVTDMFKVYFVDFKLI